MMAHVAEASESSGRVLFWTDRAAPLNPIAAQAAARLAASFNAEIETIAIGSGEAELAGETIPHAFVARSIGSKRSSETAVENGRSTDTLIGRRQRRDIAMIARRNGVACRHTESTGDAVDILAELCLVRGPWNVVVAGSRSGIAAAGTLFANVSGATGLVAAPTVARYPDGPVAVVAEDIERLPSMLRAAQRLTRMFGRIHVLPVAATRREMQDFETQTRLAVSSYREVVLEPAVPGLGAETAFDACLRRLKASYIVGRFGGTLLPTARSLVRSVEIAGAPFLLVR